jgi:hypothetical protein
VTAAVALIQMNVTPVIVIHIPFGGDNHYDKNLADETSQTTAGVATIAALMSQLAAANLQDKVTFMSLNVFGRTMAQSNPASATGRSHNPNHQVSITIGKPFKGGVIGGVAPVGNDYGCLPIVSATGQGSTSGDIMPANTLACFGQTALAAVGVPQTTISSVISTGQVITPALA